MATTKVTSNLLAPSAAQTNINSGASLTLSVPTQVNNTLTTNNKVVIDSASAITNPKMLIMSTTASGTTDNAPLVIKGSGANILASINLRSTGGSGELYDAWLSGKVSGGIHVNNSFIVSNGGGGPLTGTTMFSVTTTSVGVGITSPNTASILDVTSTTKGFLPPRMTTMQRNLIATPPMGLVIYNTTTNNLNSFNGSAWVELIDNYDLGNGILTFLSIPTSENLAYALGDTTGTGGVVLQDGATLNGPYLQGPVDIGGQDADGVDRVMTRALFDFRLFEQAEGLWMFRQGDIIATNVGSGITDSNGGVSLFSGGTANSVSLARIHGGGSTALPMYRLDWSRPLVFSGFISASATTPNGIGRLLLGVPQATTTPVDLTNKGIGIRCVGSAITLVVHNGSTLTTSATVGTLSPAVQYFRIVCDGTGNVKLYLNKVIVASTSLGPTGAAVEVGLTASATNNADAAIQRLNCGLFKIWTL